MPISEELINIETRRQVMLERVKSGVDKDLIKPMILKMAKDIRMKLRDTSLDEISVRRQKKLLKDVALIMTSYFNKNNKEVIKMLAQVADNEAKFTKDALKTISTGEFESTLPSSNQIMAAVSTSPLSVRSGSGKLLEPFIDGWGKAQIEQVEGIIKAGFYEGATNEQMIANVIGTISNNYNNGDFARMNRSASALVRTSVQHAAITARRKTYEENGVERYRWLSTLDARTSDICQGLSGQEFEFGKGPLPPAHPNCRGSITAVLPKEFQFLNEGSMQSSIDGPVSADLSYYDWLKTQSREFQDEALGKSWAKVFNEGMSSKEFSRLRLNKNFMPITLDELEKKNPVIFASAGLSNDDWQLDKL